MAGAAVIIKDVLVGAGVGTFAATTGWGIYIAREPPAPDTTITIYNTGGADPNPAWLLDFPTVQVRVRGARLGYQAAFAKVVEVKDFLLGRASGLVGTDQLDAVNQSSDILDLGFDDSNRPVIVVNFRLIVEPAQSVNTNRAPI